MKTLIAMGILFLCSTVKATGLISLSGEVYSYDEKTVTLKIQDELYKIQRASIDSTILNSIERPGQMIFVQTDMNGIASVSKLSNKKAKK